MDSDTGTVKAKEILKGNSAPARGETWENSSAAAREATQQEVTTEPTQRLGSTQGGNNPAPQGTENSVGRVTPRESSTVSARSDSRDSKSINVPVNPDDRRLYSKFNNQVAHRAYELYEQNGAIHGEDLYHWLQAESELLTRIPEVQQTDSTYSSVTPLDGFSIEDLSVTVEPRRALILADKQQTLGEESGGGASSSRHSAFYVTDWPGEVDPSTATAQIKQGNLVLTVKRAGASLKSEESGNSDIGR